LLLSGKIDPELLNDKPNALKTRQAEIESRISELERVKAQSIEKIFDSLVLTKALKTKYLQASPDGPSGLGASGVPGGRDAAALAGDDDRMRRMIGVVTKNFSEPVTYGL
jgi:hypothetical protein